MASTHPLCGGGSEPREELGTSGITIEWAQVSTRRHLTYERMGLELGNKRLTGSEPDVSRHENYDGTRNAG